MLPAPWEEKEMEGMVLKIKKERNKGSWNPPLLEYISEGERQEYYESHAYLYRFEFISVNESRRGFPCFRLCFQRDPGVLFF